MVLKTRSDGKTVDSELEDVESYDLTASAKRVILVDSSGNVIKSIRTRENLNGSTGTGIDGATNRVYTLTTTNSVDIVEVFKDGILLVETVDYTIDNTAKTVTLLGNTFNSQIICIFYNI
jgi:hypothetical protein